MPRLELVASPPAHVEPAWAVAFNPKRNILASCSTDKTIRLYSFNLPLSPSHTHTPRQACAHDHAAPSLPSSTSQKPSVHFQQSLTTEHKRTVRSISWSPTGLTLASGSFDSTVGLWAEIDPDAEDEGEGVFKPASNGQDVDMDGEGGIEGREQKEWECVTTLEGHESECKAVAWSSDGALLASCSRDKSVWVWENSDFECIAVMMEHSQDVKHLAWHPHEEILASASYDSHIILQWDDPDGDWCTFQKLHPKLPAASLQIPKPPTDAPSGALQSFQALSSAILPTEEEKQAQDHLQVPPLLEDETVWSVAFSPCGGFMASGGDLGGIRIWARTGPNPDSPWAEVLHTAAHSRSVFSLSWSSLTTSSSPSPSPASAESLSPSTTSTSTWQSLGLLASSAGDGKIIILELFKSVPSTGAESSIKDGAGSEGVAEEKASAPRAQTQTNGRNKDVPQVKAVPVAAMRDAHGVADVNCVTWLQREDGKGAGVLASCADDGSVKVWRVVSDD